METNTGPLLVLESSLKVSSLHGDRKHPFPQPKLSNNGRSHQNPQNSLIFLKPYSSRKKWIFWEVEVKLVKGQIYHSTIKNYLNLSSVLLVVYLCSYYYTLVQKYTYFGRNDTCQICNKKTHPKNFKYPIHLKITHYPTQIAPLKKS